MADDTSPSAPSTKNLKFPDWQREFEAALLETDPQKLRERLEAAEVAMVLRSQVLVHGPDGHAEPKRFVMPSPSYGSSRRRSWAIQTGTKSNSILRDAMPLTRVLLVDDSAIMRSMVRRLFKSEPVLKFQEKQKTDRKLSRKQQISSLI